MTEPAAGGQMARVESQSQDSGIALPWLLAVVIRDRRTILLTVLAGILLSIGVAALNKREYTATFSFIPQSSSDQGRSSLASLAGQFGIALGGVGGQSQPPQLYADLLKTREVLSRIALDTVTDDDNQRVPLSVFLDVKGKDAATVVEKTFRKLKRDVIAASVASRTTGVVTVTATTESPQASLKIARDLLKGLNEFNLGTMKSQAKEERRFTESRLGDARVSLRVAEDALQNFLQGNRQIVNSPELTFRRQRLEREVALQQQVVTGLSQQYEDARIREVRDTPVITVIEQPRLPAIADPRGRVTTVVIGTILATLLGVLFSILREGWRRQRANSAHDETYRSLDAEWNAFRNRADAR